MATQTMPTLAATDPAQYILHLADNALVHGQRIAQWCSHGPVLEEDIAMANIGLDHIGQARMLYQHAAKLMAPTLATACAALPPEGALPASGGRAPLLTPTLATAGAALPPEGALAPKGGLPAFGATITEDTLAYFRSAEQFLNYTILELPHRTAFAPSVQTEMDYAVTMARNFLYASLMVSVWRELQNSKDAQLAAIAGKSAKEVRYHLRHSTDWLLRMGDGTTESHTRMQAALDYLMPFTQEWWVPTAMEKAVIDTGIGMDVTALRTEWQKATSAVIAAATLKVPSSAGHTTRGKEGQHSEHLSYLLAEMQSLARAHPEAKW
jgi:ring-1,2-phenylacetyl-CoA epoxidase subunit PaaC